MNLEAVTFAGLKGCVAFGGFLRRVLSYSGDVDSLESRPIFSRSPIVRIIKFAPQTWLSEEL